MLMLGFPGFRTGGHCSACATVMIVAIVMVIVIFTLVDRARDRSSVVRRSKFE